MPISHHRRGQDKTVLFCSRLRCELGITLRIKIKRQKPDSDGGLFVAQEEFLIAINIRP